MAYPIRQGTLYNFVMCHPGSVAVGKQNEPADLDDMRTKYKTWDPVLTRIINKVPQCLKWQNAEIEKIETWISTSGKVVLMGDAAHAMVPYMAQVRSKLSFYTDSRALQWQWKTRSAFQNVSIVPNHSKISLCS